MRRRGMGPDRADLWAASCHGVITAKVLVALGVPESTVYHRCRDGGPWQLLAPGVVLLTTGEPTADQLVVAALRHGGDDAVLTGMEACRRHGVRRGLRTGPLQVLTPHERQARSTSLVRVVRTTRLPAPVLRGGVPLAPAARAVVDAIRTVRAEREIAELMSDAVQRNLCSVAGLAAELDAGGQRWTATPRRVLGDIGAGIRSAAELDARTLWAGSGLPEPWWNASVYDGHGRMLGIADAWWDEVALAWEINSLEWHLSPAAYAREQEKLARFTAVGALVLPAMPKRMRTRRQEVTTQLRAAYTAAAARPRPAGIRATPLQHGGHTPTGLQ